jgi:hypothetical protein
VCNAGCTSDPGAVTALVEGNNEGEERATEAVRDTEGAGNDDGREV